MHNWSLFLTVIESGSLRSGYHYGWVLVRALFLAWRCPHSPCILTWQGKKKKREREIETVSGLSLLGHKSHHVYGTLMVALNLITCPKSHLQKLSLWESGLQHRNLGKEGHNLSHSILLLQIIQLKIKFPSMQMPLVGSTKAVPLWYKRNHHQHVSWATYIPGWEIWLLRISCSKKKCREMGRGLPEGTAPFFIFSFSALRIWMSISRKVFLCLYSPDFFNNH